MSMMIAATLVFMVITAIITIITVLVGALGQGIPARAIPAADLPGIRQQATQAHEIPPPLIQPQYRPALARSQLLRLRALHMSGFNTVSM